MASLARSYSTRLDLPRYRREVNQQAGLPLVRWGGWMWWKETSKQSLGVQVADDFSPVLPFF